MWFLEKPQTYIYKISVKSLTCITSVLKKQGYLKIKNEERNEKKNEKKKRKKKTKKKKQKKKKEKKKKKR